MTATPKILIIDDDPGFLERVKRNIKKFEVATASTIQESVRIISADGISLIVADMKLKDLARGYEILDELFRNGEPIPVILITGLPLTGDDERHFASRGAVRLLKKGAGKGALSAQIEKEASNILSDYDSRFVLFERRIAQEDLGNKMMTRAGHAKKISRWMLVAKKRETAPEESTAILKDVADVCNKYLRHTDSTDYVFPRV